MHPDGDGLLRDTDAILTIIEVSLHFLVEIQHVLFSHASELRSRIEELSLEVQNSENAFTELNEKYEEETYEFQCQIKMLQKEILSLSSCSLAKEKENMRKDMEKTKSKLKDTESKLKNVLQEKTKLEGEKASTERELKRLQSQKAILERDMSKHSSINGRRRDSTIDRSSNVFDPKRAKCSPALAELEDEYRKLEVLAFEMETTIASLEDQLEVANGEKEAANSRAETLASNLQSLYDELHLSNSELNALKEELSVLRTTVDESSIQAQTMESSIKLLSEEKDDLSMQLTEALMTIEEEKAIWSSKEKASMSVIIEKEKHYNAEVASLSRKLSEAGNELQMCRENVEDLKESLKKLEDDATLKKQCRCFTEEVPESMDESPEVPNSQLESKCEKANEEIRVLQMELDVLRKERQYLLTLVQELEGGQLPPNKDDSKVSELNHELEQLRNKLASMKAKMNNDQINTTNEKGRLRMRLHGTQTKLDTYRARYQELQSEANYMNQKFEEASQKLKKQLASYGSQVLALTKQLRSCHCDRQ